MKKNLIIFLLFVLVFLVRWVSLDSPLPDRWETESKISFTTTILESPEHSDSKTIFRIGIWYIPVKGYSDVIPGSRIKFVGVVVPKVIPGQVVRVKMIDPKVELIGMDSECLICRVRISIGYMRDKWVRMLSRSLPEPMASLAAGILLGVKSQMSQEFYESLVTTGTLHVVAASGYNVTIVAVVLIKIMSSLVKRNLSIIFGVLGIIF